MRVNCELHACRSYFSNDHTQDEFYLGETLLYYINNIETYSL